MVLSTRSSVLYFWFINYQHPALLEDANIKTASSRRSQIDFIKPIYIESLFPLTKFSVAKKKSVFSQLI